MKKQASSKPGIPVVIGETTDQTLPVFEKRAKEKGADLIIAKEEFEINEKHWEYDQFHLTVAEKRTHKVKTYQLDLPGIYQSKNLVTVLASCKQLKEKGWKITDFHLQQGLQNVKKLTGLFGRWEILQTSPKLVLDVAHNTEGIKQLLQQIEVTPHKQLHLVIGMAKDKDHDEVLKLLPKNAVYYFTKAEIPRALPEEELASKASNFKLEGNSYMNVNAALYAASLKAGKDDLIIVCGSVFLIGEISLRSIKAIWEKESNGIFSFEFFDLIDFFV